MLVFFFLTFIFLFFMFSSYYLFPFLLIIFFLFFLLSFSFSFNSPLLISMYCYDELSLFMVFMTCFVLYLSYVFAISSFSLGYNLAFFVMLFSCILVFSTSSVFVLYLSYELSLIPIIYIIMKWGFYPERSVSSFMLLIYTSIFTFPFIYYLMYMYSTNLTFNFFSFSQLESSTSIFTFLIFFTFAVKLPIYGLHYWLPMAHVEAPTFGSMILAGVLLKLGGVGLIRLSKFMDMMLLKSTMLSYFIVFTLVVTLICCMQSDFKRLVAYSSVSHMMVIPILMMSNNLLSMKSMVMIMFMHGLSSPILFMFVGILYNFYGSRQLVNMRGLMLVSPLLSFLLILSFFFTLSAPPFPSFLGEIFFMISSFYMSKYMIILFLFYAFFSLVYNLNWLMSICFTKPFHSLNMNNSLLIYKEFIPIILALMFNILFIPMIYFL